jgi:hypothetical protein
MFFMACAELFRFRDGNEWFVAQYRLRPKVERDRATDGVLTSQGMPLERDAQKSLQHG